MSIYNVSKFRVLLFICLLLFGLLLSSACEEKSVNNIYSENLTLDSEQIVLSFKDINTGKYVTLCEKIFNDPCLIVRVGTKDNIDFEFPKEKNNTYEKYTYTYYFIGGSPEEENYIMFEDKINEYELYDVCSIDEKRSVGLNVINKETNETKYYKAIDNSIVGSMIQFRKNGKIKILDFE